MQSRHDCSRWSQRWSPGWPPSLAARPLTQQSCGATGLAGKPRQKGTQLDCRQRGCSSLPDMLLVGFPARQWLVVLQRDVIIMEQSPCLKKWLSLWTCQVVPPCSLAGWVGHCLARPWQGCFPSRALHPDVLRAQAQWCRARLGSWGVI